MNISRKMENKSNLSKWFSSFVHFTFFICTLGISFPYLFFSVHLACAELWFLIVLSVNVFICKYLLVE